MSDIVWSQYVDRAGVLKLDESDGRHEYFLDGRPIPSYSAIARRAGIINYDGVPEKVLQAKAKFGSAVHLYTHAWDEDDLDLEDLEPYPSFYNSVKGWTQFREDFQFSPQIVEVPLAIRINGCTFGVKPDRFGVGAFGPNGDAALGTVEIKTTAELEPSIQIQTAAQALAIKTPEVPIPVRIICQLLEEPDGTGKCYHPHICADLMDEKVFIAALLLDYWKRNHKII